MLKLIRSWWKSLQRYEIWNFPTFSQVMTWTEGIQLFVWEQLKLVLLKLYWILMVWDIIQHIKSIGFHLLFRTPTVSTKAWQQISHVYPCESSDCSPPYRDCNNDHIDNSQKINFQQLHSSFTPNPTVFTLSSSSRLHKSSATRCTSEIPPSFVSLDVDLQSVAPHKKLRTEVTFKSLDPFVHPFAVSSRIVISEHFLAAHVSAGDLQFSSVQCQVSVVLLL